MEIPSPSMGPQMDSPEISFLNGLSQGITFFYIGKSFKNKYFDMVWECNFFENSPKYYP